MISGQEDKPSLDDLAHHGIKGMHWGVRKAGTAPAAKISRKQNRQMNKAAANEFYTKKMHTLLAEGQKHGDKVLVATVLPGQTSRTVITGKALVKHLAAGGALNIQATEVYAKFDAKNKAYVTNDKPIGNYKKQNFRKP